MKDQRLRQGRPSKGAADELITNTKSFCKSLKEAGVHAWTYCLSLTCPRTLRTHHQHFLLQTWIPDANQRM